MLDYLGFDIEAKKLMKALENTLSGGLNAEQNWKTLPADCVPPSFRKDGKYGSTDDVAEKVLEEYEKL
jgi:hypothetical protein